MVVRLVVAKRMLPAMGGGVDAFIRQHQTVTTTLPATLHNGLISTPRSPALQPVVTLTPITAFEATDAIQGAWDRTHNAHITRNCTTIGRKNGGHDDCRTNEAKLKRKDRRVGTQGVRL